MVMRRLMAELKAKLATERIIGSSTKAKKTFESELRDFAHLLAVSILIAVAETVATEASAEVLNWLQVLPSKLLLFLRGS